MVRYLVSLMVFLAGIVLTINMSGWNVLNYLDIPSFIITGIFPFLFVSILFGFKEMALSFSISFKNNIEKSKLIGSLNFFEAYGKVTWITGLIAVIIGVIAIFINLEDKTALGPNLALALLSMLYSGIIYVLVIAPFIIFIKKKLSGYCLETEVSKQLY